MDNEHRVNGRDLVTLRGKAAVEIPLRFCRCNQTWSPIPLTLRIPSCNHA
jgi:hypothetical protein